MTGAVTGLNGIWAQNLRAAQWAKEKAKLAEREALDEALMDPLTGKPRGRQQIDYENDPKVKEGQRSDQEGQRSDQDDPTFWILHAASGIHIALNLLNGFGNPEPGDGLTQGAGVFRDASAMLGAAGSDPGWQGAAAQAYNDRNSEQRTRTNQMAALDTQLAGLLQTQADEVQNLRVSMGLASMILFPAGYLAAVAAFAAGGNVACYAAQTVFAGACLGLDGWLHDQQKLRAQTTGADMARVAASYSQIADAALRSRPLH
jgi:hypothetical protein